MPQGLIDGEGREKYSVAGSSAEVQGEVRRGSKEWELGEK